MIARTLICAATASLLLLASVEISAAESGGGPIKAEIRDDDGAQIAALNPEMTRRASALGYPVRHLDPRLSPDTSFPLVQWPLQNTVAATGFAVDFIAQHVD